LAHKEKIKNHPLLGNGLGDTVTVFSPVFKQNITTPHFDWGYLEIWAETGFIGLLAWCMLILHALKNTTRVYGYSAILLTLLVINLTSPGLFHVMGVLLIAVLLATKPTATPPSIQA
jgi:O-antigen ligase